MPLRRSYTASVERNVLWQGDFATEPYEAAWASEAIFFVRALDVDTDFGGAEAHVQISADGIRWVDEGTTMSLPTAKDAVTFCKVAHFGGFLRIKGALAPDEKIKVLVSLVLKE
ncbi:MAG: hypothetical protein OXG85_06650 [Chloroflexi bacterium]|nr:hypothetical protein [Chloroflexota bacterium]